MTEVYCLDGTPVAELRARAKTMKKEGVKLKDALAAEAKLKGYENWQALMENTVTAEVDDIPYDDGTIDTFWSLRERRPDGDIVWHFDFFDARVLAEDLAFNKLYLKRELVMSSESDVEWHVSIQVQAVQGWEGWQLVDLQQCAFTLPEAQFEIMDMVDAISDWQDGDEPAPFIALFNQMGLRDHLDDIPIIDVEFEALLALEMRKLGNRLEDRTLFHNGMPKRPKGIEVDWGRRCFCNVLTNGDVVVSNGGNVETLKWKLMPRAEFDALAAQMFDACGPDAAEDGFGEAWMHDQVLMEIEPEAPALV